MVVVSNIFVYGLVFAAAKELPLFPSGRLVKYFFHNENFWLYFYTFTPTTIVPVLQGLVTSIILFSSALFASLKSHHSSGTIMPKEIGNI